MKLAVLSHYQLTGHTMARRTTILSMHDGEFHAEVLEADPIRPTRQRPRRAAPAVAVMLPEDLDAVSDVLLDRSRAVPAGDVDAFVPARAGLYLMRLRSGATLPEPFETIRQARATDLLYLGKAKDSTLAERMVGQELRGRGHGTFIRSIGAMLGYRPAAGSLIGKANPNNYVFTRADLEHIIDWMNAYLEVSWVILDHHITEIESVLIAHHAPLLNLSGSPLALSELKLLRAECREAGLTPPAN